jgi:hypothetical protein
MSRQPTEDDGREEAYDDRGIAGGAAEGIIIRHRYAEPKQVVSEYTAERRARQGVAQAEADAGRNVFGVPWLGMARDRAKVRHRAWERMPNGWHACKRCRWPALDDQARIAHQEEHKERDRVLTLQARDYEELKAENAQLREEFNLLADELAADRYRFNALCLALGKPDTEAMQEAVDQVLSYAREVNSRRPKEEEDE